MVARNYRENCGICRHANVCEHTRAAQAIQEAAERFNQPAQEPVADPRDAEIARLKAEVEQLRESEADLIQWIFDGGQRAGIEPADLSPTEVLTRMSDDLAAHKRALAAGPAALRALRSDVVPSAACAAIRSVAPVPSTNRGASALGAVPPPSPAPRGQGSDEMTDETTHLRALLAEQTARAEKAEAVLGIIESWTHVYGASLKPPGADTYGEGKRDAKNEVAAILRGKA